MSAVLLCVLVEMDFCFLIVPVPDVWSVVTQKYCLEQILSKLIPKENELKFIECSMKMQLAVLYEISNS